jgi:hypothetical protein
MGSIVRSRCRENKRLRRAQGRDLGYDRLKHKSETNWHWKTHLSIVKGNCIGPIHSLSKKLRPSCTRGSPLDIAWPSGASPSSPQDPAIGSGKSERNKEQPFKGTTSRRSRTTPDHVCLLRIHKACSRAQGLTDRIPCAGIPAQIPPPRKSPQGCPSLTSGLSCQRESCTSPPTGTQAEPLSTTWSSEHPLR